MLVSGAVIRKVKTKVFSSVYETYDISRIEDNAVTSSIRIAQVFPVLVGKKTHAIWKVFVS